MSDKVNEKSELVNYGALKKSKEGYISDEKRYKIHSEKRVKVREKQ